MKCPLGISNFLEEISSLSHSIVFLYFFALTTKEGFLISPCYSLELCIQMGTCFLFFFAFCFPSFQRYLYGGGNEDNGDLHQKTPCMYCYTQCPQPCSRPPSTQASARDSWTHRQVWDSLSWGHCSFLLGPGVHKFLLCPPRVYFPVCCKFWQFCGGLIVTSSKRLLPFPSLWHPEPLSVQQTTANLYLHRRHSNTALSQSLWGPWVLMCTSLFEPSERLWWAWGFPLNTDLPFLLSSWDFSIALGREGYLLPAGPLPTVCLGFLSPWTWGISTQPVQWSTTTAPALGHGVSLHGCSRKA